MSDTFFSQLSDADQEIWNALSCPAEVQALVDTVAYTSDPFDRTPLKVMCDRQSNCYDGGLLAAAAMRKLGYPALIVDLLPAPAADDDHVLVVYKQNGRWGSVAKSNFVGLRWRQPVYRSLRELVMSYFEVYFNVEGMHSLRAYTRPMKLAAYDHLDWMVNPAALKIILDDLFSLPRYPLIDDKTASALNLMDEMSFKLYMTGINYGGLYYPKKS